jgi:hypothetical protein
MIGRVSRNLVPMYIGFEEDDVEYITETLGDSIQESMEIINLFKEAGLFGIEDEE